MDKKRVVLIWLIMASVIAVDCLLFGAAWWLAVIIGVVAVAAIVAGATGTLYLRQKRLLESAAKFNIDLKKAKSTRPICAACISRAAKRVKMRCISPARP